MRSANHRNLTRRHPAACRDTFRIRFRSRFRSHFRIRGAALILALLFGAAFHGKTPAAALPDLHADERMATYAARNMEKDPFEPKIEPPIPVVAPTPSRPDISPVKEFPPLPITVNFIVGSEANRMALLELNGKPYEMRAGEAEEGGLFKVLEITEKELTLYDSRVRKNRVIRLSEN